MEISGTIAEAVRGLLREWDEIQSRPTCREFRASRAPVGRSRSMPKRNPCALGRASENSPAFQRRSLCHRIRMRPVRTPESDSTSPDPHTTSGTEKESSPSQSPNLYPETICRGTPMQFKPFLLDVWLDQYEHGIEFNLAASTGPTWTVNDILALADDETRHRFPESQARLRPPRRQRQLARSDCRNGRCQRRCRADRDRRFRSAGRADVARRRAGRQRHSSTTWLHDVLGAARNRSASKSAIYRVQSRKWFPH